MDALRDAIKNYSDDELLGVYRVRHSEYTEGAVKVIEEEVAARGLDTQAAAEVRREEAAAYASASVANLSRADFVPLGAAFSKIDTLTADAILRDSKVPYFIKEDEGNPESYIISVYGDSLETARELIGAHFEINSAGQYVLNTADVVDRLKMFSFSDIRMSPAAAEELLDAEFSERERSALTRLADALMGEVDKIEEERGRVVFFYDSLSELSEKLRNRAPLTRTDFLAIIELCQIYCEDGRYAPELNQTASAIISFFLG